MMEPVAPDYLDLWAVWTKYSLKLGLGVEPIPEYRFYYQGNFTLCLLDIGGAGQLSFGISKRNPEEDPVDLPKRAQAIAFSRAAKQYLTAVANRQRQRDIGRSNNPEPDAWKLQGKRPSPYPSPVPDDVREQEAQELEYVNNQVRKFRMGDWEPID